ncbi:MULTISPECIES: hypothetical protein [unclassified Halorhabdus]|uniref:hypothetical protein n=1 Tax=unclassified Halorhabdus TaxID=2621901 RepID=UPI0012B23C16|nr:MULTISPECIES: hypothetical protein [unclassified Halorhabdus]
MPRLVLSLPTELGAGTDTRPDRSRRSDPVSSHHSIDRPNGDDATEQPRIEQWLACWAD